MARQKLLFICSANISRSRTAEDLFVGSDKYEVQSAGFTMYEKSGQLVTQELIDWADRIFVMDEVNDKHLSRLCNGFNLNNKIAILLGIKDIFCRGDEVLVGILKEKLTTFGISFDPGST